jgi:probable HAF family extracellular repeat protein
VTALIVPQHFVTAGKPSSNIIDLGTLGGTHSDAFAINNDPAVVRVVGWSHTVSDAVHAFVWTSPGPMISLGTLGSGFSQALDINNQGQIVGHSNDALNRRWAVVWTNTGGTWAIENLGSVTGTCTVGVPGCSSASGINNGTAGDPAAVLVVGNSRVSATESHAAMWAKSATGWTVQDLGTLPGDTGSIATDVNDDGEVVGMSGSESAPSRAFRWTAATGMLQLSSLGGETYALAINNNGDVAGLSTNPSGNRRAVRWRSATNWSIEDLGTLGGCCSEGSDINSFGDVVGLSNSRAFLANASGMINLGALGRQSWARAVNDFGVAAGGSGSARLHAVLWRLP